MCGLKVYGFGLKVEGLVAFRLKLLGLSAFGFGRAT